MLSTEEAKIDASAVALSCGMFRELCRGNNELISGKVVPEKKTDEVISDQHI